MAVGIAVTVARMAEEMAVPSIRPSGPKRRTARMANHDPTAHAMPTGIDTSVARPSATRVGCVPRATRSRASTGRAPIRNTPADTSTASATRKPTARSRRTGDSICDTRTLTAAAIPGIALYAAVWRIHLSQQKN